MKPRMSAAVLASVTLALAVACSKGGSSGGLGALSTATTPGGATPASTTSGSTTPGSTAPTTSTATPGSTAATGASADVVTPQGVLSNDVKVIYKLIDPSSRTWDIAVDFSLDKGQTWTIARMGQGGDGMSALASGPGPIGKEHSYVWATALDVGQRFVSDVRLRITPVGAQAGTSGPFAVDNAVLNTNVTVTRGPYLQSTTSASTIIVWKTSAPTDSVIEFGDTAALGQTAGNPAAQESTHAVTLTSLTAATTYTYRIGGSGGPVTLREQFTTAPSSSTASFKFLVFGDSGSGSQEQMDLAKKMEVESFDFALHTGDVIYPMGSAGDYDPKFFKPYGTMLKKHPIFPCIGNHDMITLGIGYKQAFYVPANNPSGSKLYYSFEWGDAKFISIDSALFAFYLPLGLATQWIENELASSTKTWNIVYFHVPMFSSGTHGDNKSLQNQLGPLLEKYKVSLVLQGHDHDYERTNPIKKWNNDPNFKGIPYIVTGGGGAGTRSVGSSSYTAKAASEYHYMLCEVQGRTLTSTVKKIDGSVIDTFTVQAR